MSNPGINPRIKDLTGNVYSRLTVLSFSHSNGHDVYWNCLCSCGNSIIVSRRSLVNNNTKSCGCLNEETRIINNHKKAIHNQSGKRLYTIWECMHNRCYNKNSDSYKYYGLKGIGICDEWLNNKSKFFEWSLSHGYKDNLSIDRIDNSKDYSPSNCRWATITEQNNNRSCNRLITFNGKTQSLSQWSREVNINRRTLHDRLFKFNWSVEKALTTETNR